MAPYRPQVWALGGKPTKDVDIPITAVFLALYIGGAVMHMIILQTNRRKGHKFLMSGMMFGFCMARTTTTILRIATISLPEDIPLSIAAAIFVAAGVVLIYVINFLFAQRIIRAQHPKLGWHPVAHFSFLAVPVIIVVTLIMLIATVVQSYYTLDPSIRRIDRSFMLYGATTYAIISFLPIPLVIASVLLPHQDHVDKFGTGRFRTKIAVLFAASALICAGACWRCGTSWIRPVPVTQPLPWYFHRAYFYIFDFGVEVLVVYLYVFLRVDLRFHVPDGAHGPGSYSAGQSDAIKRESAYDGVIRVYSEGETFDSTDEVDVPHKAKAANTHSAHV